jgi:branched-chain amino acid transport system permease protein
MNRLADLQPRFSSVGRLMAIVGGVIMIVAAFLPWAYAFSALDGMTLVGNPSPMQRFGAVLGLVVAGLALCSTLVKPGRQRKRVGWVRGAKAAGTGALVYIGLILISISLELGGLINVVYGGWVALVGAALAFVGTKLMVLDRPPTVAEAILKPWVEIVAVAW